MGCGCRKNKLSRRDRINKQRLQQVRHKKAKIKPLASSVIRVSSAFNLSTKSSICMSCSESKQSPSDRKKGIRVCRKSNRLVNNIIRDPRFVCPLGKWRNSK